MSHTPHEIHEEFPHQQEAIHALKMKDPEFAALLERYHEVNRAIHRAETNIAPTDDSHDEVMRKQRLHLKDAIAAALRKA